MTEKTLKKDEEKADVQPAKKSTRAFTLKRNFREGDVYVTRDNLAEVLKGLSDTRIKRLHEDNYIV